MIKITVICESMNKLIVNQNARGIAKIAPDAKLAEPAAATDNANVTAADAVPVTPAICISSYSSPDCRDIFPAFFYTLSGRRSTDEWLAYSLLDDLANLRIMTAGQLARWIKNSDRSKNSEEVSAFITELFRHRLIEKTTLKIPVMQSKRIREGEYDTQEVSIIYLTEQCRSVLEDSHSGRFARYGCPDGVRLDRVYHDLLITEAILTLAAQYRIYWIKCEDMLKSELSMTANAGSRSVPDFRVWLEKRDENGQIILFDAVDGEVIVQSDMEQVAAKPKDVLFFTQNLRAADMIKTTTGKSAFLLSNPALPIGSEAFVDQAWEEIFEPEQALLRKRLKLLYKNHLQSGGHYYGILYHLHQHGPLTAASISALTGAGREEISRNLKLMTTKKILHFEDVQASPGAQTGRPSRLFAFVDTSLSDYDFRLKQLERARSIERNE